jgi:cysteine synthase
MLVKNVIGLIGNTPMVRVNYLNPNPRIELYLKLEKFNPGGSVKDRIAKYMIQKAEETRELTKDKTVIEPTSGNTGLGAKIVLSEESKGMNGAEDLAHEIVNKNPDKYFMPNQFANQANVLAHYETTAEEIWRDTEGKVTHFVAGIGTTGTLVGVSKRLKEYNAEVKIIAVQPEPNTVIQGLKNLQTQYIPKIWRQEHIDEICEVNSKDAEETARLLALREGIFVGPSSGAIFHVASKKAREIEGGVMVVIAPDGGEKYLSTTLCDPILCLACVKKYGIHCSYSDGTPVTKIASFDF